MKIQYNKLIVGGLHLAAGALIKHGWIHASAAHWLGGAVLCVLGYLAHNPPPEELKQDAARLGGMLKLAFLAGMLSFAAPATAQTNNSVLPSLNIGPLSLDGITNLPTATNYASAKLSFDIGVATKNGATANSLKLDGYVRTNWMFSCEIQNAAVSGVIQNMSLFAGRRLKVWDNAQIDAQIFCRRSWVTDNAGDRPSSQGGICTGATWDLVTGGKVKCRIENRILTDPSKPFGNRPQDEVVAGASILF